MTTRLVPIGKIELLVGVCQTAPTPDKSAAWMLFVPVTSGMTATQFEIAPNTRFVKLHKIVGGLVSRTITVRTAMLVLPLPSPAVYAMALVPTTLMFTE